jgi:hypothetical protein
MIIIIVAAGLQAKLGIDITIYELCVCVCVFFPTVQQTLVGLGLLVIEALRSHTHTHTNHSVGLIWTSDQPVEATSTGRQITLTRKMFQIRTCNLNKRAAADPCIRPRRHWGLYVCVNVCTHEHIMCLQV